MNANMQSVNPVGCRLSVESARDQAYTFTQRMYNLITERNSIALYKEVANKWKKG